ncbi:hypothetical protein ACFOPQ_08155 [Deinococcus antarcticus]|uniref:ASCH domain-containing protein n=1 Tax=Deinococcus antarcticus TaxID=1298767 RepID=A0ABV8A5K1_9DEIO
MSKVQFSGGHFSDDQIDALINELTNSGQEFLFFTSEKFWKRFGVKDEMREFEAEVSEKLKALGVTTSFEVSVNFVDEEAQAAFTDERIQAVVNEVEAQEDKALFLPAADFWGHFGLADTMTELQSIASQKLGAAGLTVSFEVVIGLPQEEDGLQGAQAQPVASGDPFTPDALAELVTTTAAQENQMFFPSVEAFWGHFGLTDRMQEHQEELREQLSAAGVDVSFDVVLSLIPPELPLSMEFEAPAGPSPLDLNVDTVRALSIRQPWVELILRGEKNLEYRSRRMKEMGPLLLHSSRTFVPELFEGRDLDPETLPFGALVGVVDVVGCIEVPEEEGLYAYQLAHPRRFKVPVPYSGAAGIFRVPTSEVRVALANGLELVKRA